MGRQKNERQLRVSLASLVPPDVQQLGMVKFNSEDRRMLDAWLGEEDWPRGRMNITTIEGYLVALIIWPVEMGPGGWLPPIWGTRGWKVPSKIASLPNYERFIRLIVGFRQQLAQVLNNCPVRYLPDLTPPTTTSDRSTAAICWARGFLTAVQHGAQGFEWRSAAAMSAVRVIVDCAQSTAPLHPDIADQLGTAALALVAERSTAVQKSAAGLRNLTRRYPSHVAPMPL